MEQTGVHRTEKYVTAAHLTKINTTNYLRNSQQIPQVIETKDQQTGAE